MNDKTMNLKDQVNKLQLLDENWGQLVFDGATGNKKMLPKQAKDELFATWINPNKWVPSMPTGIFDNNLIYRRPVDVEDGNVLVELDEKMKRVCEMSYDGLLWWNHSLSNYKTPREIRDNDVAEAIRPIIAFRYKKETL